jgi:hypothetical protein
MISSSLPQFPVRTLFYCEFTWTRDSKGRVHLQSELSAFGPPFSERGAL